jgi:lipopolysaccharide export system permease protein
MFLKTYVKYISKEFTEIILKVSFIFYSLIFILTIFEELNFFKEVQINFIYPIFLTFLNSPTILYDIFPFIFLISTQLFFIRILERNELIIYKNFGLNNFKILKILTLFTLISSLLIISIFYNLSAKFKFLYLDLKNDYADDNKYLAVITENGLWVKDEIENSILIINAGSINDHFLMDVSIIELTKNFNLIRNIEAEKADIKNTKWIIFNATQHLNEDNITTHEDELYLDTHFNLEKINNLFSDLSSLTMWGLEDLKNDYESLGYSTLEIDTHRHMIIAYPIYLTIMTMLSGIIMLNVKVNKSKMFNLLLGISLSVIIFYIKYFFNILGENGKIPIILSIWFPLIILSILCSIGLVRINEK